MAKHINITDDIKNKIIDFTHGDNKYWKNQYNKIMNEMNNIKQCLYCKRRFNKLDLLDYFVCNEELCDVCDDEWGFGQHFWDKRNIYGGNVDFDGIVLKYLKIQKVLDEEH